VSHLTGTEVICALREAVAARTAELESDWQGLQQAKSTATKSTAGDKHETARAHVQREMDQLASSIARLKTWRSAVFPPHEPPVFQSDLGLFVVAIPFGKFSVGQRDAMAISGISPLGSALLQAETTEGTGEIIWRGRACRFTLR
jgi:hypothetical protein